MEKEVIKVEDKAQDVNILEDTNVLFLKSRINFLQVQMEDMEKVIITLMKVTDGLMCHAMVGTVTSQTKIKRKLKKIEKQDEEKDLAHEDGLDW